MNLKRKVKKANGIQFDGLNQMEILRWANDKAPGISFSYGAGVITVNNHVLSTYSWLVKEGDKLVVMSNSEKEEMYEEDI